MATYSFAKDRAKNITGDWKMLLDKLDGRLRD